jgi:hypothetical protein
MKPEPQFERNFLHWVASSECVAYLSRAAQRIDRASELREGGVSGRVEDPTTQRIDLRVYELLAVCRPISGPLLGRFHQTRVADNIRNHDRG